ncbi:MAG: hypothetical protein V3V96_18455 [Acidiferrobacterales bacterium]
MRAFIKFNKGLMGMPWPWRLWSMLLVVVNLIVPLFFLNRLGHKWSWRRSWQVWSS